MMNTKRTQHSRYGNPASAACKLPVVECYTPHYSGLRTEVQHAFPIISMPSPYAHVLRALVQKFVKALVFGTRALGY